MIHYKQERKRSTISKISLLICIVIIFSFECGHLVIELRVWGVYSTVWCVGNKDWVGKLIAFTFNIFIRLREQLKNMENKIPF